MWTKLKLGSDWGFEYWSREPLDSKGFANRNRGVRFRNGEKLSVRLADGAALSATVEVTSKETKVNDMGSEYRFPVEVVAILVPFHGTNARFSPGDVEFELAWVREHEWPGVFEGT